jgi:hypothetical protein
MFQDYRYRVDGLTGLIETKILLNIGEKPKGFTDMVLLFFCGLFRVFTVQVHAYIAQLVHAYIAQLVHTYIAQRDFVELSDVSISSFFHYIKFI